MQLQAQRSLWATHSTATVYWATGWHNGPIISLHCPLVRCASHVDAIRSLSFDLKLGQEVTWHVITPTKHHLLWFFNRKQILEPFCFTVTQRVMTVYESNTAQMVRVEQLLTISETICPTLCTERLPQSLKGVTYTSLVLMMLYLGLQQWKIHRHDASTRHIIYLLFLNMRKISISINISKEDEEDRHGRRSCRGWMTAECAKESRKIRLKTSKVWEHFEGKTWKHVTGKLCQTVISRQHDSYAPWSCGAFHARRVRVRPCPHWKTHILGTFRVGGGGMVKLHHQTL